MNEQSPKLRSKTRGKRLLGFQRIRSHKRPSFVDLVGADAAEKYRQDREGIGEQRLISGQTTRRLGTLGIEDTI